MSIYFMRVLQRYIEFHNLWVDNFLCFFSDFLQERTQIKRISIIGVLLLSVSMVWAQRHPVADQYFYELFLMNPAAAGFNKGCTDFKAFHRQQWSGMEDAPTTQMFSYQGTLKGGLGIGSYIYNDKNGNQGELGLQQAFSYEVFLKKEKYKNLSLTFGLALSFNQHSVDERDLIDDGDYDPIISGGIASDWGYNAATGFLIKYNSYSLGFSITNLLPQNNPLFDAIEEPPLPKTYHYHFATYFKHPDRDIFWEPSIMFRESGKENNRFDINLKGSIPSPTNTYLWIWGALNYRRSVDYNLGKSLGLGTTVGVIYKKLSMGLEYQVGLTSARSEYGNAMQLVVGYRFCKRPYGGIPCSERDYIMGYKYKSRRK